MGLFDDIASALPDVVKAATPIATDVIKGLQLNKQMRQAQRSMVSYSRGFSGVGFPSMGFGVGANPVTAPMGMPTSAGSSTGNTILDQFLGGLGFNFGNPAGPSGGGRRVVSVFQCTDPNGRTVMVRSLGRPLLWSGDLAAAKRVTKTARKLSHFIHHRRPR